MGLFNKSGLFQKIVDNTNGLESGSSKSGLFNVLIQLYLNLSYQLYLNE